MIWALPATPPGSAQHRPGTERNDPAHHPDLLRIRPTPMSVTFAILIQLADFWMIRKMLLNLRREPKPRATGRPRLTAGAVSVALVRWSTVTDPVCRGPCPHVDQGVLVPGPLERDTGSGSGAAAVSAAGASGAAGSRSRLSSRALTATRKLDPDIDSAAISGRSTRPNAGSNTPAAMGRAIAL